MAYDEAAQRERLEELIRLLADESGDYRGLSVPEGTEDRRRTLRALMNLREPAPLSGRLIALQNAYLREELARRGTVRLSDIPALKGFEREEALAGRLSLWQGDITRLEADAIVNAANAQMLGCFVPLHACIDNSIHSFAGLELRQECAKNMAALRARHGQGYEQPTALPMLTEGYCLPARKVIHVVGPIVQGALTAREEKELEACYLNTLDLCLEKGLRSVAFCCISTGVFRFPGERAARIACAAVTDWLRAHPGGMDRVIFNVFKDEDRGYYERILGA